MDIFFQAIFIMITIFGACFFAVLGASFAFILICGICNRIEKWKKNKKLGGKNELKA